jgi:OOP family OmpA-OmpF porin
MDRRAPFFIALLSLKTQAMKNFLLLTGMLMLTIISQAQLLKKLKQKAESAVNTKVDKELDGQAKEKEKSSTSETEAKSGSDNNAVAASKPSLKVYSKFDFVPGSTVIYYDNFEKDNVGEAPAGWITTTSAEVVTVEGLEGNWLKMQSQSSEHIIRSKKQSWGNDFSVEFDLLIVKDTYDPRMNMFLMHTGGNLVTDEAILKTGKKAVLFESIISEKSRITLTASDKRVSDIMNAQLPYNNTAPVHVSMCVQGKRFRMWWNENKLYDVTALNEQYVPNQLGFSFGSVGGSDFYISNIRVAKDVPDTRAAFEQGKMVSNLLFYTGTAKLRPESMGSLLDLSKVLKDAASAVKIVGHTDSDGEDAANQQLSQERAGAVKNILVEQYGMDKDKLTIEGRGESQPIADNKTAEGKAQNRRVEFIFKEEADKYVKPAGVTAAPAASTRSAASATTTQSANSSNAPGSVVLQSKLLNITLPYAQFMKSGDNKYTFIASKEEGNSKENYFSLQLQSVNMTLKPETFNFNEINQRNELYGTKKFSEIMSNQSVLYYGTGKKPYIHRFTPIIANGHMANYVDEGLARKLPPVSPNCKLVIEKVENGKASGYFVFGMMSNGLNPIKKGDAMQETFTEGFSGEIRGRFVDVPVY